MGPSLTKPWSCDRDYSAKCPAGFMIVGPIQGGTQQYCAAGTRYNGPCDSEAYNFDSMSSSAKERWSELCLAFWPCIRCSRNYQPRMLRFVIVLETLLMIVCSTRNLARKDGKKRTGPDVCRRRITQDLVGGKWISMDTTVKCYSVGRLIVVLAGRVRTSSIRPQWNIPYQGMLHFGGDCTACNESGPS